MSMRCGNCDNKHESVAEVRACYGVEPGASRDTGPTDKQWQYLRDLCRSIGRDIPSDKDRRIYTFESIKPIISELKAERDRMPKQTAPAQVQNVAEKYSEIIEGRYAFPSLTGNNDLDFVKVDRPTEGRWSGYIFVNRVVGGKPDIPVRGPVRFKMFDAILAYGPERSRIKFGKEIKQCWKCGRHLTDETSRELGIGPDCAQKQ